jgi:lipoprotein
MKKSILMLASLALLSACGKEANEPVVKQTQQEQAGDRITIALNGTIDEDMAKALSYETYTGANGKTAYSPVFSEDEIPALLCIYNNDEEFVLKNGTNVPYQMREVVLTLKKQMVGGRTVTTFECKTEAPEKGYKQFALPSDPGIRRTKDRVWLDPEKMSATLVVGFNKTGLSYSDGVWSKQKVAPEDALYTYGANDLDLTKSIPYVVENNAPQGSHSTRPVFVAENIKPVLASANYIDSKHQHPYILFPDIKLKMKGVILRATVKNNSAYTEMLRPVALKVDRVGRADLRMEEPTVAPVKKDGQYVNVILPLLITPQVGSSGYSERNYTVSLTNKEALSRGESREYVIYMPIANSLLADRESKNAFGPSIQVLYRDQRNEKDIKGKITYLSPLKKEGIVVSTTLDMVD